MKKNKFKGDLYLLVDEGVYSAAEGMANFCKNAKIAKLVGKKTGGDGVTLGLINDVCPNSGLVFTYTNTRRHDKRRRKNKPRHKHRKFKRINRYNKKIGKN